MRSIVIAAALLLVACHEDPITVSRTNNGAIQVELLFEHEGCKVYRFHDENYHYFVRCPNADRAAVVEEHAEPCGKNCTRIVQDTVQTEPAAGGH